MLPKKLVFVDIETTGTSFGFDRIIEIGIIRLEGNREKTFQTLINPETRVSSFIEGMTGITQKELDRAPSFFQIKDEILEYLENAVFVAHNAKFDYGFLKKEFGRLETPFSTKQLCTAKLSKYLFPRFHHHDLDSLIERFQFTCERRHRAFDDAHVLKQFYDMLQTNVPSEKLTEAVNFVLKKPSLPLNLPLKQIKILPETPGVYIFYGNKGIPLYVGKSINIKDRILSHFSQNDSSKEMKIAKDVRQIETIKTKGELGALIRESNLVKKLQPIYNRQLRISRKMVILKSDENENGYKTVRIETVSNLTAGDFEKTLGIFRSIRQTKDFLETVCREQSLCKKLLFLEKGDKACFGFHLGTCKGACLGKEKPSLYNLRFILAFAGNKISPWPFPGPILIEEKNALEQSGELFLVDKWCLIGSFKYDRFGSGIINPYQQNFDVDIYKILKRFLKHAKKEQIKNINPLSLTEQDFLLFPK